MTANAAIGSKRSGASGGSDGILPDFIVIGAMRAATTTLHTLLSRHPRIGVSRSKETDFFIDNRYGEKWAGYHAEFTPGFEIYGEASPNYSKRLVFPQAARRIVRHLPEAKLVYVVRDPADRLVSHYAHLHLSGAKVPPPERLPDTELWDVLLDASRYHRQIMAYTDFLDRGQIQVIDFDDLVLRPVSALTEIGAYLGVPEGWKTVAADGEQTNSSSELAAIPAPLIRLRDSGLGRRIRGLVTPEMRQRLRAFAARGGKRTVPEFPASVVDRARRELAADAAELRALTGRAFGTWSI